MKKISQIFALSFLLNFIWENLHSYLYIHYMGGKITELILIKASLVDATIITLISLPFLFFINLRRHSWIIAVVGILIAISMELYALGTSRWAYNQYMPIIPFLNTGLTPTIQLALLGYLSYFIFIKKQHETTPTL